MRVRSNHYSLTALQDDEVNTPCIMGRERACARKKNQGLSVIFGLEVVKTNRCSWWRSSLSTMLNSTLHLI